MTGYQLILLKDIIEELGEEKTKEILSQFSCPLNLDVETFLHNKAIEFAKQSISATHFFHHIKHAQLLQATFR